MMGCRAAAHVLVAGGGYLLRRHHRGPITTSRMVKLFPQGLSTNHGGQHDNGHDSNRNKDADIELGSRRRLSSTRKKRVRLLGRATDNNNISKSSSSSTRRRINGLQNKIDDARVCAREKIQGLQHKMGDVKTSAREKIENRIEGVRGRVEDRIEGVRDKVGDAKASARVKMEVMQERVDDATERGKQTLKTMWQRYGMVAIGTYFSIYVGVLGALFCIFDSGLLTAADLPTDMSQSMMNRIDGILSALPDWLENFVRGVLATMQEKPKMQTLTVAWLATKLTEPLRLITTIFLTPRVARALGRAPKRLRKKI